MSHSTIPPEKPQPAGAALAAITTGLIAAAFAISSLAPMANAASFVTGVGSDQTSGDFMPGDSFRVYFNIDAAHANDDIAVNGTSCTVNGSNVTSTFTDATGGLFFVTYTVGANDPEQQPGTVPMSCSLKDAQTNETTLVTAFNDGNQIAVNVPDTTTTGGTVDTSAFVSELAAAQTAYDNAVEGTAAGQFPTGSRATLKAAITSTVAMSNDPSSTQADIDGATATLTAALNAFEAQKIGSTTTTGGNSTTFSAVTLEPDHSIRSTGYPFLINLQAPAKDDDMTPAGPCTVNGVDVGSSLQNLTAGLYNLHYTVGANDTQRAAGQIPIFCTLHSPSSNDSVAALSFTDSNTAGIDPTFVTSEQTVQNSATSETVLFTTDRPTNAVIYYTLGNTTLTTPFEASLGTAHAITITGLQPNSTYLYEVVATDANNVEGTSPETLSFTTGTGGGTTGTTTVQTGALNSAIIGAQNDLSGAVEGTAVGDFAPGSITTLQMSLTAAIAVRDGSGSTQAQVDAATTGLNLAVGLFEATKVTSTTGGTTGGGPTIVTVAVPPTDANKDLAPGSTLDVYFQAGNSNGDLTVGGTCTVNGSDVSNSFLNLSGGLYKVTYSVGAGDPSRTAGDIPVSCTLKNSAGQTVTISGFTDDNQVSVTAGTQTGPGVVRTTLYNTIQNAQNVFNTSVEGSAVGDFAVGSKATLQTAINVANTVCDDTASTQAEIDAAVVALNSAVSAFEAGKVTSTTGGTTATSTNTGTLNGNVDNGTIDVTSIVPVSTTASADGSFADGWKWVFNVTVPENETNVSMKFADWTGSAGGTIPVAGNMEISSTEAASSTPVVLNAANSYSAPLSITGDRDLNTPGRQIQITVQTSIPTGTQNGSYSTSYGLQSNP